MKLNLTLLCLSALVPSAFAQSNLRVWYEHGQTWVRWTVDVTLTGSQSWSVYRSPTPITDISSATLIAKTFPRDVQGGLLQVASVGARWVAPDPDSAGSVTMAANQALFVYTPRVAASEYFAVVKTGNTALSSANTFGPVAQTLEPIVPHVQLTGTDAGHPYKVYALWVDGDFDPNAGRSDFPVMANASMRGVPRVFAVFEPTGVLPPAPRPTVVFLHGGDGSFWNYRPSKSADHQINLHIENGLYVTFDDRIWIRGGPPFPDQPYEFRTRWFGMSQEYDRFEPPNVASTNSALVPDTTPRFIDFVLDWLVAQRGADPDRIAMAGLSMGGRGASIYLRSRPGRICAGMCYVPTIVQDFQPGWEAMFGGPTQNLPTTLGVNYLELMRFSTPLSPLHPPFTRVISGTNDVSVGWIGIPGAYGEVDDERWGWNLYWDERQHTATGGGWASAHFHGSQKLSLPGLTSFSRLRSFPALHDIDHAIALPGEQPDPGSDVLPHDGDDWGARGGWFAWDDASMVDTAQAWGVTIRLRSGEPFANDNSPTALASARVTVRRPQLLQIAAGDKFYWRLEDATSGAFLRSGTLVVGPDGLVTTPKLLFTTSPRRLELRRVEVDSY